MQFVLTIHLHKVFKYSFFLPELKEKQRVSKLITRNLLEKLREYGKDEQ